MSARLSKDLTSKHSVRSIPIRKGDEVKIVRGSFKTKSGKVTTVYRKKWCIYVEKITKDKPSGQSYNIPIHPSNVVITNLNLQNKSRKDLIDRKARKDSDKHKKLD